VTASRNAYPHPIQNAQEYYQEHATAIDRAAELAIGARTVVSVPRPAAGLPSNLGMVAPLDVAGGAYLPLTQDEAIWWHCLAGTGRAERGAYATADLGDAPEKPALLDFMAARVLIETTQASHGPEQNQTGPPQFQTRAQYGPVSIAVNERALPRTYWAPQAHPVGSLEEAIETLTAPDFDPEKECVATVPTGLRLPGNPDTAFTRADALCAIESEAPERVVIHIESPAPGFVVLADSFAPGWKARLDGASCRVFRTNGLFRGVSVPAGEHRLAFEYRPRSFTVGLIAALAALAVSAVSAAAAVFRGA